MSQVDNLFVNVSQPRVKKNLGYSNEAMIWKHPGCLESVESDFREDLSVVVADATAVKILQVR